MPWCSFDAEGRGLIPPPLNVLSFVDSTWANLPFLRSRWGVCWGGGCGRRKKGQKKGWEVEVWMACKMKKKIKTEEKPTKGKGICLNKTSLKKIENWWSLYCYVKEISRLNVTQRKTLEKLPRSIRSEKGTRHRIIRNCWTQEG